MKYCHGTDSERKDLLWVWTNRFFIGFFTITIVILTGLSCYVVLAGEPSFVVLLLGVVIVASFPGLFEFVWRNGRYKINSEGITVLTRLKERTVSWNEVQEIGIFPVISDGHIIREYILIFTSERHRLLDDVPTLWRCWFNNDETLAIRCTDERLAEFEKALGKKIPEAVYNNWTNRYEIKQDEGRGRKAE